VTIAAFQTSNVRIGAVREIGLSADELVASLLSLGESERICILDSCGVGHLGSHLLIAGLRPVESIQLSSERPQEALQILDEKFCGDKAAIFTISYDFGLELQNIRVASQLTDIFSEPDIYLALFDVLVIHNYRTGASFLSGNASYFSETERLLAHRTTEHAAPTSTSAAISNFSRSEYISAIETIKEFIRTGDTYQTNLTQQIRVQLSKETKAKDIFWRLRKNHPAPFAAYISRNDSLVVSASPERFFKVSRPCKSENPAITDLGSCIFASPIKGTRRRGRTIDEDELLKNELLESEKDRAENTMIVDLLRNDVGRVCEFGSVEVDKLCELEAYPTLFHLVSAVSGELRPETKFSEILGATFPCGSITGAPKIRTMEIISEFETANRGLSMGAIGCYIPPEFGFFDSVFDLNVAIRTMVIHEREAVFNVGGGITIDSDPGSEYDETLLKAKALLNAIGARFESRA
jgi:para-aminobenzoate synthetase component I